MEANLSNFLNTAYQQGVVIYPSSPINSVFESTPRFILRNKGNYQNKLDKTKIENYDIGIPFIVDQRQLLNEKLTMTVTLLDQSFLQNNNLSGVTSYFSVGLVNAIIKVNPDIIDDISVKAFVNELQDLSEGIKSALGETTGSVLYENYLLSEFEKLYLLQNDRFKSFYLWANSKRVIKTQEVLLNNYLTLEKLKSDMIDKEIVDIEDYTDSELFGLTYEFNLKEIQQGSISPQTNANEFSTYINPSKFHQINTDSRLNGDNISNEKLVKKIYKNLNDPASAFKGANIFENLYSQVRGICMPKDKENLQDTTVVKETHFNNELTNRLIDSAVSSKTRLNKINQVIEVDPISGSSHYQKIKQERFELEEERINDIIYSHTISPGSKRYKKIYVYFNLKETQLNKINGDKFTIDIKSENNLISHEQFYYAIDERFKNYLFSQFNQEDIIVSYKCPMEVENYLLIENNSDFEVKCEVEVIKKVDSNERYKDENDIDIIIDKKSTTIYPLQGYKEIYGNSPSMFLRYSLSVYVKNRYYPIDSFKTIKVLQDNPTKKNTKKCAVFAFQTDLVTDQEQSLISISKGGFKNRVILYCNDSEFLSAKFYKRNVSESNSTVYEELTDINGENLGFVGSKVIDDIFYCRASNTFEYIAQIMTNSGNTYYSSPFRIKMFKHREGYVDCNLSSNKQLFIQKQKDHTSFIQQIFDIIKNDKEEGLYNDDLKAINQATKDILFAEVEALKYSPISNSFYYHFIGDFSHNQVVNFKTSVRGLLGSTFVRITPYQSSPILVINLVNDLISRISNDTANLGNAVEQSILLSKLKPIIDEVKNVNRVNLLSSEFLKDGIIPATDTVTDLLTSLEKIKKSVRIDDTTVVRLTNEIYDRPVVSPLQGISVESCSYIRYNDYRLYINFNLSVNEDNINKIDFYIIMAEREKVLVPVTSIRANKTGKFGFFDETGLNYSGETRYFLLPVLMSGQFSEAVFLKSVIINEYRNL